VSDGTATLYRIAPGAESAVMAAHLPHDTTSIAGDGKGGVWAVLFDTHEALHFTAPA
jgi:hypothetical protein